MKRNIKKTFQIERVYFFLGNRQLMLSVFLFIIWKGVQMKRKQSPNAVAIDRDYRRTNMFREEIEYREQHCTKCINYDSNLCEIRRVDGQLSCIYFKERKC